MRLLAQCPRGLFRRAGGGTPADRGGRPGSIINVSSQMGHVGGPNRTVYCATKHAIEGLTKAMAVELAPHGIRVNTMAPDLHRDADDAAVLREPGIPRATCSSKIKLGRLGKLEDLMGAIVFLASRRLGPDDRHIAGGRRRLDGRVGGLPSPCCSGASVWKRHSSPLAAPQQFRPVTEALALCPWAGQQVRRRQRRSGRSRSDCTGMRSRPRRIGPMRLRPGIVNCR